MKIPALTGLSKSVINDLVEHGVRTVEIRSMHNLSVALNLNPGDIVFVTDKSREDITPGTVGILARVKSKEVSMRRIGYYSNVHIEEVEQVSARLQLEYVNTCRITRSEDMGIAKELFVIITRIFEAW